MFEFMMEEMEMKIRELMLEKFNSMEEAVKNPRATSQNGRIYREVDKFLREKYGNLIEEDSGKIFIEEKKEMYAQIIRKIKKENQ